MAGGGGVTIDFDKSLFVQLALFTALLVVMKPLLVDPMLRIFEAREKRTDGERASAREMEEKAGELLKRYETELGEVRRVAAEERERTRAELAKLEAEMLAEAHQAVGRIVEEGRAAMRREAERARSQLAEQSPALVREVASTVLGREVH
ncbi:MAG: ATP synthase F0 subunit B [Polyangiaceae bacterium]|nr:ATP synthase F0 subunit B [Polyangiaceae bacterium]